MHRLWNDVPDGEVFLECKEKTDVLIRYMTEYRAQVIKVTAENFIVWLQLVKSIKARIIEVGNIYY